jgi:hypothetical protein
MNQSFRAFAITLGLLVALSLEVAAAGEVTIDGPDGNIPTVSATAQAAVDMATADLAERLGVDPSIIAVVGVEGQTWSDASLGCPEPDRLYAQVLVDGFRILLSVGDDRYEYHSGPGRVVLCWFDGRDYTLSAAADPRDVRSFAA